MPKRSGAYAHTEVHWARTQAEITTHLAEAGILDVQFSFIQSRQLLALQFVYPAKIEGRPTQIGVRIILPDVNEDNRNQKHRLLMHYLKNKFEAVSSGLVTFAQEFFPYIIVPNADGSTSTMFEALAPQLTEGLRDGRIRTPELFPMGARALGPGRDKP
ncbi:MAG: hypothetical protein ACYC9Q_14970 [Bacillota bacterium]